MGWPHSFVFHSGLVIDRPLSTSLRIWIQLPWRHTSLHTHDVASTPPSQNIRLLDNTTPRMRFRGRPVLTMAHDLEIARSRAAISRVRQQLEMVAKEQLFHAVFASPSHSLAPSWLVLSQTPPLLGDWVSHLPEQPVRPEQPLGCP